MKKIIYIGISIVIVGVGISWFLMSQTNSDTLVEGKGSGFIHDIQGSLPIKIDEEHTLIAITDDGQIVIAKYMFNKFKSTEVNGKEFMRLWRPSAREGMCMNPGIRKLFEDGIVFRAMYYGTDEKFIVETDFSIKDCE